MYGLAQSRNTNSPNKTQLLHPGLVDREGKLTITVNMNDDIISRFKNFFNLGSNIRISKFAPRNKGKYDRGNV